MTDESALEALYTSRDHLILGVSQQRQQTTPTVDELHALGSAIVANLAQLGQLSSVLAEQVGRFDEDEIEQARLSNHPEVSLRMAGTYLHKLSDTLALATADANRYWTAIEHVDLHTTPEVTHARPSNQD